MSRLLAIEAFFELSLEAGDTDRFWNFESDARKPSLCLLGLALATFEGTFRGPLYDLQTLYYKVSSVPLGATQGNQLWIRIETRDNKTVLIQP